MTRVGIVYEGKADSDIVEKIVEKVLADIADEYEIVKLIPANSGIIGFLPSYVTDLFDHNAVNLAVFFTDQDVPERRDDRRRRIRDDLEKIRPGCGIFCAIGVSDPHLEQWIISDEDVLKSIFGCAGDKPLPFAEQQPKFRLKSLWSQMPVPKESIRDTCLTIIDRTDLTKMRRHPDFNIFADELIAAYRRFQIS